MITSSENTLEYANGRRTSLRKIRYSTIQSFACSAISVIGLMWNFAHSFQTHWNGWLYVLIPISSLALAAGGAGLAIISLSKIARFPKQPEMDTGIFLLLAIVALVMSSIAAVSLILTPSIV